MIFERYNFTPNDLSFGWDGYFLGKKMDAGIYTWFAKIQFVDKVELLQEGDLILVK